MRHWISWVVTAFSLFVVPGSGLASGPRYVTGPPYFYTQGQPIPWAQQTVMYSTDPGGLSTSVNHQAADALVAAAAGVWNVPVANVALGLGGTLAEHVSRANLYLGRGGMVYPADVDKANYAAVPIAVIYDTDGSVTDMLLGLGASSPSSCRQNGVTESVDRFDPAGFIQHAIIVLNGRCTGAAPQLQLQMQYQLERVFGRVLGLAWSQTNDNVLMGVPTPTYNQALHWPIMHPLDVICGLYTYQCLPQPFVLRPDDIASLVMLYPVGNSPAAGKQPSLQTAQGLTGTISFPTGEGMAGVNMLVRRESQANVQEDWYESSAVSGALFHTNGTSPFVAADTSVQGSQGSWDQNGMGSYTFPYIPMQTGLIWQYLVLSTEAVNPLYFGPYSLQPYAAGNVSPSGTTLPKTVYAYVGGPVPESYVVDDAAAQCGTGMDGTAAVPVAVPTTGWWNGLLCGQGHTSYVSLNVQPGRSLTVEVTALDELGYATTSKTMPVIGIYAPTDGTGDLPSVAAAANAFQALGLGMTTLFTHTGSLTQLKVGIGDQRGAGRPDFGYQARIFYADTLTPATLPVTGGTVTIAGMGFRQGNQVQVNGVTATVSNVSANSITVTMPAMTFAHATVGAAVDVVVSDLSTGASSTLTGGLTYGRNLVPNIMKLVSAQTGTMYAGDAAPVPFAVQVLGPDGATPVVGVAVVFSTSGGNARFSACGAMICTQVTDANGMASTGVTPTTAGAVTMVATSVQSSGTTLTQSAGFTALAQDASLVVTSSPGALLVGTVSQAAFAVQATGADGRGASGRLITFSVTAGSAIFSGCNTATCAVTTDWSGSAGLTVTAQAAGSITLQATDGNLTQSVSVQATTLSDILRVISAPTGPTAVNLNSTPVVVQLLTGDGVTPKPYQSVVYSVAGAPPGVTLAACGASRCTLTSSLQGYASTAVMASQAGTYTVQATYGALTQSVTVTFIVPTDAMRLVSAPTGTQAVGTVADKPFTVQMLQPDGVTAMSGTAVSFAMGSGTGTMVECGARPGCMVPTDANGMASVTVVPSRAGSVTMDATFGTLSQVATFMAVGTSDTMVVLASPGMGTYTGDVETFTVQVFGVDGVTPAVGRSVVFSVANGSFAFTGCTVCTVVTDGSGKATISGASTAAGPVSVVAADGAVTQSMTFSTTARADVMRLVSAPAGNVVSGYASATAFAVQVFGPDGVTPAVGRTVTFAVTVGSVQFTACGTAPCAVVTDGSGIASTTVMPLAAGATSVLAAEGQVFLSDSFTAVAADVYHLSATTPAIYVAAGASFATMVGAVATINGDPASGVGVSWKGTGAVFPSGNATATDGFGGTQAQVLFGPMVARGTATATGCAWTMQCATFAAHGVGLEEFALEVVSGGAQAVSGGAALTPVVARVTDGAGDPVAGAAVTISETVSALGMGCPARGRCPVEPVLGEGVVVLVSDAAGMVSVTPMTVAGVATETKLLLTAGTQAVATADAKSQP